MSRIRKFLKLSSEERWLFIKVATLLLCVRLSLLLLPFTGAQRLFSWISRYSQKLAANPIATPQIAWTVDTASHFVPGASHCLTRAITTQILLVRRGYPAKICFGVLRESAKDFIAHAWVECNGSIIIGGDDVKQRYIKLEYLLMPTSTVSTDHQPSE